MTLADAAWFAPQSKKRITPYQGGSASFYIGCCCYCCLASFCETSWVSEHLLGISLVARVVRYRHGGDFCNLHADQCPAGYGAKQVGNLENFLLKISSTGWWFQTWLLFPQLIYLIWDIILPIGELHHFSRWLLHQQSASNIYKSKKPTCTP